MSEVSMSKRVMRALKKEGLDPVRVENPVHPGTPDVNHIEGWIELKWVRAAPVNGGVVKVDHFTPQQRNFLRRRCRHGGDAHLLLKVGQCWMLFKGDVAADIVGRSDMRTLWDRAFGRWGRGLDDKELVECLTS